MPSIARIGLQKLQTNHFNNTHRKLCRKGSSWVNDHRTLRTQKINTRYFLKTKSNSQKCICEFETSLNCNIVVSESVTNSTERLLIIGMLINVPSKEKLYLLSFCCFGYLFPDCGWGRSRLKNFFSPISILEGPIFQFLERQFFLIHVSRRYLQKE